jgi:antitoxin ParD1/3/4
LQTITRQKVAVGLQQIEHGEVIDGEAVIARLQEKIKQARSAQS